MKKLLALVVISTCAVAGWRAVRGGGEGAAQDGGGLVLDRIWIDHIPKHDRDQVSVFAAITDEPIGVFQTASAWKGHFELFHYEANGGEIRIVYPQDNYRERVRTRAQPCSEDGFDYCLELDGSSHGVKRYYSRKGWEIEGASRPDQIRARVDAALFAK